MRLPRLYARTLPLWVLVSFSQASVGQDAFHSETTDHMAKVWHLILELQDYWSEADRSYDLSPAMRDDFLTRLSGLRVDVQKDLDWITEHYVLSLISTSPDDHWSATVQQELEYAIGYGDPAWAEYRGLLFGHMLRVVACELLGGLPSSDWAYRFTLDEETSLHKHLATIMIEALAYEARGDVSAAAETLLVADTEFETIHNFLMDNELSESELRPMYQPAAYRTDHFTWKHIKRVETACL